MQFIKMHGAGNDYIYIDGFREIVPDDLSGLAVRLSHRRFGIGGDGVIWVLPSQIADARMRMFNADGSESEMCGNGIRCVAKYVFEQGITKDHRLRIETGAGVLEIEVHVAKDKVYAATVDMGVPQLEPAKIPTTLGEGSHAVIHQVADFGGTTLPVTCVSMGNPHCVIFVPELTDELVLGIGPKIETDPRFPRRTNVEFVEILSRSEVRQRTWERGSGETWACGTGASAVCVAGVLNGVTDRAIRNHLLGGTLELHWEEKSDHVFMTGPAVEVFRGQWDGSPNDGWSGPGDR